MAGSSKQPNAKQHGAKSNSSPERPGPEASAPAESTPTNSESIEPQRANSGEVQFQLAGLQTKVEKSSRRVKILAALAALLLVSLIGTWWYLRHSYIMQFAELDQLEITHSNIHTGTAIVRFRPLTAGRIQFVRTGGDRQETLLEYAEGATPEGEFKEFHWTGDVDGKWSISIRFRDGSELIDRDWDSSKRNGEQPGMLADTAL